MLSALIDQNLGMAEKEINSRAPDGKMRLKFLLSGRHKRFTRNEKPASEIDLEFKASSNQNAQY